MRDPPRQIRICNIPYNGAAPREQASCPQFSDTAGHEYSSNITTLAREWRVNNET
ncbi:hypothetical protein J6590_000080 [Homalodisca vitripennis]|nr:hypothetical protein J6590_000080 [Homalodisca vitripennis]